MAILMKDNVSSVLLVLSSNMVLVLEDAEPIKLMLIESVFVILDILDKVTIVSFQAQLFQPVIEMKFFTITDVELALMELLLTKILVSALKALAMTLTTMFVIKML